MNIRITGRHMDVTDAMRDYIEKKIARLNRYYDRLMELEVTMTADNEADPTGGVVYRWRLGLLGLWVEKYQSMSRVMEEVQRKNI